MRIRINGNRTFMLSSFEQKAQLVFVLEKNRLQRQQATEPGNVISAVVHLTHLGQRGVP
jgi:hypothetical protein